MEVIGIREFRQRMKEYFSKAVDGECVHIKGKGVEFELKCVHNSDDCVHKSGKNVYTSKKVEKECVHKVKEEIKAKVPDMVMVSNDNKPGVMKVFMPVYKMGYMDKYHCGCDREEGKVLCGKHGRY